MFDFPNNPVVNQSVTAPNGGFFIWDGLKWTNGAGPSPTLYLPLAGGTMGGPLTLSGNATQPLHAVPLRQILPATGGTVTGPLNYTATGGTTVRSAQDRAADVANVLDFGADPTGGVDSAAAFNAAANQRTAAGYGKTVYVPAGKYVINSQIVLNNGQGLAGDTNGSSVLVVTNNFNATATSVVYCASSVYDPGPTIRDINFWMLQPSTVTSRSTFKTIANGGTAGEGGTGVQYPWVIDAAAVGQRIGIQNVRISGAWNGINATKCCFWIDGLQISAFNIGLAIGGTVAAGVLDWSHISDIEFWTFGLPGNLQNVYMDGQTIAIQIGNQNGLEAQNISCFTSRIVFTPDAAGGWFDFTNLSMDGGQSTIETNGYVPWLKINNLYTTSGTEAVRPLASFVAGKAMIANWYSHNSSPHPILSVSGADVSVVNSYFLQAASGNMQAVDVSAGTLRISNSKILPAGTNAAWTAPLINQGGTGILQLSNVDCVGDTGSSGNVVQFNVDAVGNQLANVSRGSGWNTAIAFGNPPLGNYGSVLVASHDSTSMQTGAMIFNFFGTAQHFSTAYGYLALGSHGDGGNNNTAFGAYAGFGVTSGAYNTFVGAVSGYQRDASADARAVITGNNNTCIGAITGYSLTTGGSNTLIGTNAGQPLTTGSNNVLIGNNAEAQLATTSNYVNLGDVITATGRDTPSTSMVTIPGALGSTRIALNPISTNAHLNLGVANNNSTAGVESKLRLFGSFPSGGDFGNYLAASLRAGWTAFAWGSAYLNVWLTNAGNGGSDDANMIRVAGFTAAGMSLPTLPGSTTYANDAAAAAGGVGVGQLYRNGSAVMCRIA